MSPIASIDIGGIKILDTSRQGVGDLIDQRITGGGNVKLAFCNAHTAEHAFRDRRYKAALNDMVVVNDGIGIELAARINHGRGFRENLNGTDFVPWFLSSTPVRRRIFLLGARPHVVARAAAIIAKRFTQHEVVGTRDGYFGSGDVDGVLRDIDRSGADTLLVALGNPRQEIFIQDEAVRTKVKLFIGVGALFDFLAGEATRAPVLVRRMRMEWAYRLAREPVRLARRYLLGTPYVLGYSLYHRFSNRLV